MLVYRITNTVNGKVYIGKWEGSSVNRRWKEHRYRARRGSPFYFHNAIRKYGAEAFTVEVLHQAKTKEELRKMETFFIILHQSHKPENGYNLTMGGDGLIPNEETRRKMSGVNHHQYRKPIPQAVRDKISKSMFGRTVPQDVCDKISKTLSEMPCVTSKEQLIANLGTRFKDRRHSESTIQKMKSAAQGRVPWNKGRREVNCAP